MKNLLAILITVLLLTSCGNSNNKCENCNDSATVACDTTNCIDSICVDTTLVK